MKRISRRIRFLTIAIVGLAIGLAAILFFCNHSLEAAERTYDASDVDQMISGWKGQVDLLKWIGGSVVGAMGVAIGFLMKSLQQAQSLIVQEVKTAGVQREKDAEMRVQSHAEMLAATTEQTRELRALQCRLPCVSEAGKRILRAGEEEEGKSP